MNQDKKISVIIPLYNAEEWIEECVLSVVNQTYENKEIIVVDNESTDSSVEIVESLIKGCHEISLSSAPNIYPYCWDEAREVGFNMASGDYFFTLCSDDHLDSNFLASGVEFIQHLEGQGKEVKAIQSPLRGWKDPEEPFSFYIPHQQHWYTSLDEFKNQCLSMCPVTSPSVFFRRDLFDEGYLKTYPEKYSGAADYDLYCRLATEDIFIHPAPIWIGYYYHWHKDQATWGVRGSGIDYDALIKQYWADKWLTRSKKES